MFFPRKKSSSLSLCPQFQFEGREWEKNGRRTSRQRRTTNHCNFPEMEGNGFCHFSFERNRQLQCKIYWGIPDQNHFFSRYRASQERGFNFNFLFFLPIPDNERVRLRRRRLRGFFLLIGLLFPLRSFEPFLRCLELAFFWSCFLPFFPAR